MHTSTHMYRHKPSAPYSTHADVLIQHRVFLLLLLTFLFVVTAYMSAARPSGAAAAN